MKLNNFDNMLRFLNQLQQAKISYNLAHHRDEALMVIISVPGERWEVEFLDDGSIEAERFISEGDIEGLEALNELLTLYKEPELNGRHVQQRVLA